MELPLYQVDAFTDRLFGGNPAGFCPLDRWLPDGTMQAIAAENNVAETAFFRREGDAYRLRWFTPTVEVELCGHATLASAYVISSFLEPGCKGMAFDSRSGRLTVTRTGDFFVLDFPRARRRRSRTRRSAGPWAAHRAPCLLPRSTWPSSTAPRMWPHLPPTWRLSPLLIGTA